MAIKMALCSPNLWSKYWVSMAPQGKKLGEPRRRGLPGPCSKAIANYTTPTCIKMSFFINNTFISEE